MPECARLITGCICGTALCAHALAHARPRSLARSLARHAVTCARRGPGVVGEQPILEPGRSFEYQSACPLFTTFGTMEGEYEMVVLDEQGEWGERFEARIGRFALRKPEQA